MLTYSFFRPVPWNTHPVTLSYLGNFLFILRNVAKNKTMAYWLDLFDISSKYTSLLVLWLAQKWLLMMVK